MKYARVVAVSALALFPLQVSGQPIVCASSLPDPCGGRSDCAVNDDQWRVAVGSTGQTYLNNKKVSREKLEAYAAGWAKEGTWPIVVQGYSGTKQSQIAAIVAMFQKAGVKTRISCVAPQH